VNGQEVRYAVEARSLHAPGASAPLEPESGVVMLELLLDRTSLEVFGNWGRVAFSSCFVPDGGSPRIELFAAGGTARLSYLAILPVKRMWK
jgi:levanase/fructan beta-fructosidase